MQSGTKRLANSCVSVGNQNFLKIDSFSSIGWLSVNLYAPSVHRYIKAKQVSIKWLIRLPSREGSWNYSVMALFPLFFIFHSLFAVQKARLWSIELRFSAFFLDEPCFLFIHNKSLLCLHLFPPRRRYIQRAEPWLISLHCCIAFGFEGGKKPLQGLCLAPRFPGKNIQWRGIRVMFAVWHDSSLIYVRWI